jgi:hypothetical protein
LIDIEELLESRESNRKHKQCETGKYCYANKSFCQAPARQFIPNPGIHNY